MIPSGSSEISELRLPRVTLGLMALLLAGLVFHAPASQPEPPPTLAEPGDATPGDEASEYWREHAHLEASPDVVERAMAAIPSERRRLHLEALRELARRRAPLDPALLAQQQAELDRLTREAGLAKSDSGGAHPSNTPDDRLAFDPSAPTGLALVAHVFLPAPGFGWLVSLLLLYGLGASFEARWGGPASLALFAAAAAIAAGSLTLLDASVSRPWIGLAGPLAALAAVHTIRLGLAPAFWIVPWRTAGIWQLRAFEWPSWPWIVLWGVFTLASVAGLTYAEIDWRDALVASTAGLAFGTLVGTVVRFVERRALARAPLPPARGEATHAPCALQPASASRTPLPAATESEPIAAREPSLEQLLAELQHGPEDPDAVEQLWQLARREGQPERAAPFVTRRLRSLARTAELDEAADLWCELVEALPGQRVAPAVLTKLIGAIEARAGEPAARAALAQCLDAPSAQVPLGAALQLLEWSERLEPSRVELAAQRVLDYPDLHESKRTRIEARLRPATAAIQLGSILEALEVEAEAEIEDQASPPLAQTEAVSREPTAEGLREPSLHGAAPAEPAEPAPAKDLEPWNEAGELEIPDSWGSDAPEFLGSEPPQVAAGVAHGLDLSPEFETPNPDQTIQAFGGVAPPALARPAPQPAAEPPDLEALPRFDRLATIDAIPTSIDAEALYVRLASDRKAKLAHREVEALAVAAVRDLSRKPVVVIDLVLNWSETGDAPLRCIRLRSDRFDPSKLVRDAQSPTDALRRFLAQLLHHSQARPLPDADAARGRPFRAYKHLRTYERRVLKLDV